MWQDYLDAIERFGTALSPLSPLLVIVIGAMLAQRYRKRNDLSDSQRRRVEQQEQAAQSATPTVQQIWAEQRAQRAEFEKKFEDQAKEIADLKKLVQQKQENENKLTTAFTSLRDVFLAFAERVRSGGSMEFTMAEHLALELPVVGEEDDQAAS